MIIEVEESDNTKTLIHTEDFTVTCNMLCFFRNNLDLSVKLILASDEINTTILENTESNLIRAKNYKKEFNQFLEQNTIYRAVK